MPCGKKSLKYKWNRWLQKIEGDHCQRVTAAKSDESELIDNRYLFGHNSSELNSQKDRGSDRSQKFVQD